MEDSKRKTVLIVEDEPDLSVVFANLLSVFGVQSKVAESGSAAKNSIANHKFDFIIIDLTLPDMSGLDLYKEMISANPEYRGNVIFTSGMNASAELGEMMKKDDISFLAKPFSIEKLKETLDKWL